MKKVINVIVSFLMCMLAYSRNTYNTKPIPSNGEILMMAVDTIHINDYQVVHSGINGHYFLIQSSWVKNKKNVDYVNSPGSIIYYEDRESILLYSAFLEKETQSSPLNPEMEKLLATNSSEVFNLGQYGKEDQISVFRTKPSVFVRFFMRGDLYNYLSFGQWVEGAFSQPISLKSPYAYFVVYVPIQ